MSSNSIPCVIALALLVALSPDASRAGGKSHVGVAPNQILNLRVLAPANNTPVPLKLDVGGPSFTVPAGYVFVATDVQILPSSGALDPNQQFLVFVNFDNGEQRYLFTQFIGTTPYTASFTSGFVAPAGATPNIVNLTGSDGGVFVSVQGYLTKATALPVNTAP